MNKERNIIMKIINMTPHIVRLNDGREFPPSGIVARVGSSYTEFDARGVCCAVFGGVTGVPAPENGTLYIASGMVAEAMSDRDDVVAPATGHPECVRKDGQVWSVPGFVKSSRPTFDQSKPCPTCGRKLGWD
jgi:hypothetical protein